jgi:hypothetical protein
MTTATRITLDVRIIGGRLPGRRGQPVVRRGPPTTGAVAGLAAPAVPPGLAADQPGSGR